MTKIKAYKGFDADMKCRGFAYEVGQTYTHDGPVKLCESGFHACENPLDVPTYYPSAGSRFAEVVLSDVVAGSGGDTKCAGAQIEIVRELSLHELIAAAIEYATANVGGGLPQTTTGDRGVASATGDRDAASATGDYGAASATGVRGAALATGYYGAASATGYYGAALATGDYGAASATRLHSITLAGGYKSWGRAANCSALFLVERAASGTILSVFAGIAGRDGIKPDTWYTLKDGQPVEVMK